MISSMCLVVLGAIVLCTFMYTDAVAQSEVTFDPVMNAHVDKIIANPGLTTNTQMLDTTTITIENKVVQVSRNQYVVTSSVYVNKTYQASQSATYTITLIDDTTYRVTSKEIDQTFTREGISAAFSSVMYCRAESSNYGYGSMSFGCFGVVYAGGSVSSSSSSANWSASPIYRWLGVVEYVFSQVAVLGPVQDITSNSYAGSYTAYNQNNSPHVKYDVDALFMYIRV